jgi:hypothetical protein
VLAGRAERGATKLSEASIRLAADGTRAAADRQTSPLAFQRTVIHRFVPLIVHALPNKERSSIHSTCDRARRCALQASAGRWLLARGGLLAHFGLLRCT